MRPNSHCGPGNARFRARPGIMCAIYILLISIALVIVLFALVGIFVRP
jgi:hypothetical protein